MKNVKRILSLVLILVMALTVTGCIHKKDEIAVKIGDIKFTSAYYMCALLEADSSARNKVDEQLSEDGESTDEVDYSSQKIDDKKYEDWVRDTALDSLKEIAAWKMLCEENNIEADEELLETAESNATAYWEYEGYGISTVYESNGVSKETYLKYSKDTVYKESYFRATYGEGGKKAIAAEEVKTTIYENYLIVNILEGSYEEDADDVAKEALKTEFEKYAKQLQDGVKTFEELYNTYNNITPEEDEQNAVESEPAAKDEYAQILAYENSVSYASDYYEDAKALKVGEAKVIENDDGTGLYVMFKQDITADEFYLTELDMDARHSLKDEDYDKEIKDYTKKLDADVSKYAINQFKLDELVYPQAQSY